MQIDRRTVMAGAGGLGLGALMASGADAHMMVAKPESVGFSSAGLKDLDAQTHGLVDQKKLASVITLVARKGKVVHLDAYGSLRAGTDAPVKTDSIFRLASMTKPTIGAVMMMLWEQGRWKLDDPVAKFIPEFKDLKVQDASGAAVPQATPMTMRQLMSHNAGFGRNEDYAKYNFREGNLQDMINRLASLPLFAQPGTKWLYGPSVDIQGYVIEKLTGESLDVAMKKHLYGPLDMVDTNFWVDASKSDRVSSIHTYKDGVITPVAATNTFPTAKPSYLSGSGGLFSTIEDYNRFCQMILNGGTLGGHRYLKASTVKLMHKSVLNPGVNVTLYSPDTVGLGFGMDFAIVEDQAAAKTSQGPQSFYWGGAFGTWFWIDPVNDLFVIGFIQNVNGSTPNTGTPPMRELSAKAVYAALKPA